MLYSLNFISLINWTSFTTYIIEVQTCFWISHIRAVYLEFNTGSSKFLTKAGENPNEIKKKVLIDLEWAFSTSLQSHACKSNCTDRRQPKLWQWHLRPTDTQKLGLRRVIPQETNSGMPTTEMTRRKMQQEATGFTG